MGHGGHGKCKASRKPGHGSNGLKVQHPKQSQEKKKKTKVASIKNKIRSVERLLNKDLPIDVKSVQLKHLEELKSQAEEHKRAELERKMAVRYHKVKFFERRKIDRGIKRLEKLQSADNLDEDSARQMADELLQLKEDLEYVRFFPKTEKYISLFMGNKDEVIAKRQKLREQIKANLAALAAKGLEPEEMESEEDQPTLISDDDFFLVGSSSDDEAVPRKTPLKSTKLEGRGFMSKKWAPPQLSGHDNKQPKRLPKLISQSHDKGQSMRSNNKKRSELNGQGQPTINAHKRKRSEFHDQRRHMTGAELKSKKQKPHVLSPFLSSRPSSNHGEGLQVENKQAGGKFFKGASTVPSPGGKAAVINGPPCGISSNAPTVIDMANPDVKKKRKRKHRPRSKK